MLSTYLFFILFLSVSLFSCLDLTTPKKTHSQPNTNKKEGKKTTTTTTQKVKDINNNKNNQKSTLKPNTEPIS
jgi:hypothetical protein